MTHFWSEIVRRLRRLFRKVEFQVSRQFALSTREDRIFFALVPTVGLVAGGLAVVVQRLSEGLRVLLWGYTPTFEFAVRTGLSGWRVLLALVTGGVLVAILQRLAKAPLASHGVSSLVEAVALHGGRLSVKPVLYSAAAAIATVGSGGSLGREGPMLRLGAAVSSWLGQRLGLSSRRLKILLGCGTAAGFAAAFNVPIGGSLFAMEVVLGSFALEIFGPIVVAAVLATLLSRAAESAAPIYPLEGYALASPWEIGFHFGLGLVGAVAAVAFVLGVRLFARLFRKLAVVPEAVLPVVGLALLAGLGFFWPEVLGNGFSTITSALREEFPWRLLALLAGLKLVATALTAGSGCPGGHFTPSLCFGALVGGAYGELVHSAFPHATASSGSYAAVGMAAVAAGSSHAPLSAILILFELTGNYDLILPLMIAAIVSSMVAKRLYPYSIYTEPLERRGVELSWRMEEAALAGLRVADLVRDDPETLLPTATYAEVVERFLGTKRHRLFVVDAGKTLLGFVSLHDFKHALRETESLSVKTARDLMAPVTDDSRGRRPPAPRGGGFRPQRLRAPAGAGGGRPVPRCGRQARPAGGLRPGGAGPPGGAVDLRGERPAGLARLRRGAAAGLCAAVDRGDRGARRPHPRRMFPAAALRRSGHRDQAPGAGRPGVDRPRRHDRGRLRRRARRARSDEARRGARRRTFRSADRPGGDRDGRVGG